MNPAPSSSHWPARLADAFGRVPAFVLALFPLVFFGLMVVGLVRWYTPVPFWDMWDAYLYAYAEFMDGRGWRELFGQTNEHRIWFSNALFYLDLTFFDGRSLLLVPMNGVLAVGIWCVLGLIARRLLKDTPNLWPAVFLCLGPLCFSWLQEQNLSWGFQSQFFFAYLFPLAAFVCLAKSFDAPRSPFWFLGALLLGLASLGTMANGILVLPMLVAMLLTVPRPRWAHAAVVLLIGVVAITFWFQGYFLVDRDRASFAQVATFVLTFFGMPFGVMFDSKTASAVAGGAFVISCLCFTVWWLRRRSTHDPMVLALLAFLAYVGASCIGSALGRAAIQPNAALVSRYATPSLIALAVLAILFAHKFRHARFARPSVVGLGLLVAVGLFDAQRQVLSDVGPDIVHRKLLGALALKMRVDDLQSIGEIYPTGTKENFDHVRDVADRAERLKLSIMAYEPLAVAVAYLGKVPAEGFHPCSGAFEEKTIIDGEDEFRRVKGWVFDEQSGRAPAFAYVVAGGVISGIVETGFPRRDVAAARDKRAGRSGFTGYVLTSAIDADLSIYCAENVGPT